MKTIGYDLVPHMEVEQIRCLGGWKNLKFRSDLTHIWEIYKCIYCRTWTSIYNYHYNLFPQIILVTKKEEKQEDISTQRKESADALPAVAETLWMSSHPSNTQGSNISRDQ